MAVELKNTTKKRKVACCGPRVKSFFTLGLRAKIPMGKRMRIRFLKSFGVLWLISVMTSVNGVAQGWIAGTVEQFEAASERVILQDSARGETEVREARLRVAREDGRWLAPGSGVLGRRTVVGDEVWLEGVWPLTVEALEQLNREALAGRDRSAKSRSAYWSRWEALDLAGERRSLADRTRNGAVVLFLPLGAGRTSSWIEESLRQGEDYAAALREFPELASVAWIVASTTPERDSALRISEWRNSRPRGATEEASQIQWVSLMPANGSGLRAALGVPYFETEGQPVVSLPVWAVVDRRGEPQVLWQGWTPPFAEWTRLLRDR